MAAVGIGAGAMLGTVVLLALGSMPAADGNRSTTPEPRVDYTDNTPPPTPYDLQQTAPTWAPESRGMLTQIVRSLIALLFVVALIYICAKLILPRVVRGVGKPAGMQLRVIERAQLDARHAIFLIEVQDGPRLLLGTGEQGVQLLSQVAVPKAQFNSALAGEATDAQRR